MEDSDDVDDEEQSFGGNFGARAGTVDEDVAGVGTGGGGALPLPVESRRVRVDFLDPLTPFTEFT